MSIVDRYGGTDQVEQTGLKVDGVQQAVDNRQRVGVNIFRPIILGRDPHQEDRVVSSLLEQFRHEARA